MSNDKFASEGRWETACPLTRFESRSRDTSQTEEKSNRIILTISKTLASLFLTAKPWREFCLASPNKPELDIGLLGEHSKVSCLGLWVEGEAG